MNHVAALIRRELEALFFSPIAYISLLVFVALNGFLFCFILQDYSSPNPPPTPPLHFFFDTGFFWITFWFIGPALTMRLFAEERKTGTFEALMTTPVSELEVVLGKFLAVMIFFCCMWSTTLVYVAMTVWASGTGEFPAGLTALTCLAVLSVVLLPVLSVLRGMSSSSAAGWCGLALQVALLPALLYLLVTVRSGWEGTMTWYQLAALGGVPLGVAIHALADGLTLRDGEDAWEGGTVDAPFALLRGSGLGVLVAAVLASFFLWTSWRLDIGPLLSGYLGTFLLGGVFLSMGTFMSTLTSNQIVAFLLACGASVMIYFLKFVEYLGVKGEALRSVAEYVSFIDHSQDFARGIIDLQNVVYYVSLTVFFLFLSVRAVESQRWR